jgi:replicative DNA helicase
MDYPLPYDIPAEQAAIGAAIRSRDALITLAGILQPDDFYLEKHGLVWEALLACYQRREPPDPTIVLGELDRRGALDIVGGETGIRKIITAGAALSSAMYPEGYGRVVREAAIRRRGIEAAGRIAVHFYDQAAPLGESIATAERELHGITRQADSGREWRTMADLAADIAADVARAQAGAEPEGVETGYADLDAVIARLFPSQFTVIGARPAVGKTSLLLSLADNLAARTHHAAAFSLEMHDKSLGHRAVAMYSGVETRRLRGGDRLSPPELAAVTEALATLTTLPITINDTPGITLQELTSKARRLHAERPIACLFVDYLQLVKEPAAAKEKRYLEVSAVARGLKDLARDLNIHIIALSQLNRDAEDRVPNLSDLRESGEIEQAADNVWMLYRPADKPGITEIHIVKHREGPLERVELRFDARTTRFQSVERYREAPGYAAPAPRASGRQNGKGRAMAERLGTRAHAPVAPAVDDFFRSSEDHDFTPLSEGDDDAAYGD